MTAYGSPHRLLACGDCNGAECYACGMHADSGEAAAALAGLPCQPGGWDHPPYVIGREAGGAPILETCAAHPYAADCAYDAPILAALDGWHGCVDAARVPIRAPYGNGPDCRACHRATLVVRRYLPSVGTLPLRIVATVCPRCDTFRPEDDR